MPRDPVPVRRAMTVGDLAAVMAIETQAYSHPWSHGNFVDSLAAGHLAEVLVPGEAASGGTPSPLAPPTSVVPATSQPLPAPLWGYFVAMPGVDELHLLNLTVAPARQGRGQGTALLEAVVAHARARRLATVWLEVRASNDRARALYTRRGFEVAGVRRNYYPAAREREDAVVMRRVVRLDAVAAVPAGPVEPVMLAGGSEGRRDALD